MMKCVVSGVGRSDLGARLDDLLGTRFLTAKRMDRVWLTGALPPRLNWCVRHFKSSLEWRAYGGGDQLLFAAATPDSRRTAKGASPAIRVFFLDATASVYSAGIWEHDSSRGWWLDAVVDPSYDCEHGWWLESLLKKSHRPSALVAIAPKDGLSSLIALGDMRKRRAESHRKTLRIAK